MLTAPGEVPEWESRGEEKLEQHDGGKDDGRYEGGQ